MYLHDIGIPGRRQTERRRWQDHRRRDSVDQGMPGVTPEESQGTHSSRVPWQREWPGQHLVSTSGFQNPERLSCVVLSHPVVIICYRSHRKPMQDLDFMDKVRPLPSAPGVPSCLSHNPCHTRLRTLVWRQSSPVDRRFMRVWTLPFLLASVSPGPGA